MPPTAGWKFDNTYTRLSPSFFARVQPVAVASPRLLVLNTELGSALGLDASLLQNRAALFAGNELPEGADPIAQAYAGHQYAHFTLLGDGRAVLLGEQQDPRGQRWDVQLKGSGQTPFSRRGDGRAAVGPMLREFVISEAMFALGIPTTRSLAVVSTGQPVFRERVLPGAVLTRVAASHIRVGTFEFAMAKLGVEGVRELADYSIRRHYPECAELAQPYLEFLKAVIERQAKLIAQWMAVGFAHGVMNTDNMLVSGETIDYGPCAFLDAYDPDRSFSSIDQNDRYSFGNQPPIAQWNLARLAETLLPLLSPQEEVAVELAKSSLEDFAHRYHRHWLARMRAKIGLSTEQSEDLVLVESLLALMQEHQLDFTGTFRALSSDHSGLHPGLTAWVIRWAERRKLEPEAAGVGLSLIARNLMQVANPDLIPRNQFVEAALRAATEDEDLKPFQALLELVRRPYQTRRDSLPIHEPPAQGTELYRTYCGT